MEELMINDDLQTSLHHHTRVASTRQFGVQLGDSIS